MPQIPIYDSKRSVQPQARAPMSNDSTALIQGQQKVIGALTDIAQQWSAANDVMQETEAMSLYETRSAEVVSEFENSNDTSPEAMQSYLDQLKKIEQESTAGMSNKMLQSQVSNKFRMKSAVLGIKMKATAQKKRLVANSIAAQNTITSLYQNKFEATTDAEASQIQLEIDELIAKNTATGAFSPELANKLRNESRIKAAKYEAMTNPERFLARKKDYYDIPGDQYQAIKDDAISTMKTNESNAEFLASENMKQNEAQLILNLAENEVKGLSSDQKAEIITNVTQMSIDGVIDPEFAEAYINTIQKGKLSKTQKKMKKGFGEYVKTVFSAENDEDRRKAVIELLNRNSAGNMDSNELAVALKVAHDYGNDVRASFVDNVIDYYKNLGQGKFGEAAKSLGNFYKMDADRMTYDFFEGLSQGKNPDEAKIEALEKEQIRTNPNRSKYSVGQEIDTPIGKMYVWGYYEDGEPDVRKEKPPK